VIAFRRGSVPEVVEHDVTGFVVDGPDDLGAAIRRIDRIDRSACRRHVERDFDLPVMVDGYERVFRRLAEGRSTGVTGVGRHAAAEQARRVAG